MASHLQVSQENSVVRDTFSRRCGAVLARKEKGEFFDVKVAEFDGAYYNIKAEKKTPALVTLSVALPDAVNMPQGAAEVAKRAYDTVADGSVSIRIPPEKGYGLTLDCDLSKIQDEAQAALFCSKIASVRALVQGIPLRKILTDLQQGKSVEKKASGLQVKKSKSMYVKPLEDSVVVVFPVHLDDENDATLAVNFLQHFAETKRTQQNLANAPSCAYHLNPPLEVKEALAGSSQDSSANGGYMSFSIFSRHVSSPDKVDSVSWKLLTFLHFISYHIKASKGHIQSRMRTKADEWLKVLAQAKATPQKKKPNTIKLQG